MEVQFKFTGEAWKHNERRLVNQIFKMLPTYEKEEDWKKQRDTVLLELQGYNGIFASNPSFMLLVAKLNTLPLAADHTTFRKTIFEAITALRAVVPEK